MTSSQTTESVTVIQFENSTTCRYGHFCDNCRSADSELAISQKRREIIARKVKEEEEGSSKRGIPVIKGQYDKKICCSTRVFCAIA